MSEKQDEVVTPERKREFVEEQDRIFFVEIQQLKEMVLPTLSALFKEKEVRLNQMQLKIFGKYRLDPDNMPKIDGKTWEIIRK
ncbi:MAG: hypothetical protein HUU50_00965 [Candidatus Brocadiae bacterium]|nr:hypothetical protein [Candidatus Brocadiia bacterium]